jgi:hypothetical protein
MSLKVTWMAGRRNPISSNPPPFDKTGRETTAEIVVRVSRERLRPRIARWWRGG